MAKALGKELNDFYQKGFPEGFYHDYDDENFVFSDNPDRPFAEDQKYELSELGYIIADDESESKSFSACFSKWKKSQNKITLLVEVPIEAIDEAKANIKALGYKVL